MAELEKSLRVRILAAERTVRFTDQRSWSARERGKNSGYSRKLTSCTLTTTGTGQASGAVYCTCSRSGRSWRRWLDSSKPRRTKGLADTRRTAKRAGTQGERSSTDRYVTNSDSASSEANPFRRLRTYTSLP